MTMAGCTPRRPGRGQGLTLIELMIALVVVAVLAAIATPSMYEYIMRKRVQGVADELLANLRLMRSASNVSFGWARLDVRQDASTTCYAVYSYSMGGFCNCLNPSGCNNKFTEVHKLVQLPLNGQVRVTPAVGSATQLIFHRFNGLPMSAARFAIEVWAPRGGKVLVSTNESGQPSICSVSGHNSAYPAC